MNTPPSNLEVTQADRDAAAPILRLYNAENYARICEKGLPYCDQLAMLQAFARHRIAHQRPSPNPSEVAGLADDEATLDVFLAAYADHSDGEVIAGVVDPLDDLLTLGALRRILTALRSIGVVERDGVERLPDDEAASLRIIETAWREAGISARPFFGEAYEPGTIIRSIVRQVAALSDAQDTDGEAK